MKMTSWNEIFIPIIFILVGASAHASGTDLGIALKARFSQKILFQENVRLMQESKVRKFYDKNGYTPVWYSSDSASENALTLLDRLRHSREDGLRPREYHVSILNELLSHSEQKINEKIDAELLLTDSFINYVDHLLYGRTRPALADPEWHIFRQEDNDAESLLAQLSHARSVNSLLDEAAPQEPDYQRLRAKLKSYLAIRDFGGWKLSQEGRALKLGERGKVVQQLNKLLMLTADLAENSKADVLFDEVMSAGLVRFQLRHGLTPSGVLDRATRKALSISVNERIIQIELNMERWRWLPRKFERPSIVVNAPEFKLEVLEKKGTPLAMKVVIGKQLRRTPVFEGRIETMVVNPKWVVPDRIAVEDLLPAIKKNPGILKRKGFRVYRWKGTRLVELASRKIQWKNITPDNFNFQLVQDPGPQNVQGKFKFIFPNNYGVYIHDTPSKGLFDRVFRTYSSGCIRVENASGLAEYFFKNREGKNWEQIQESVKKGSTLEISVEPQVAVYLLYWTAWVGEDNLLNFRNDIYGRDALLRSVLAY